MSTAVEIEEYRDPYYARNRERIREQQNQRYAENPSPAIERARGWAQTNPSSRAAINRRARLRSYGLTERQYEEMWVLQMGTCAICHDVERTHPQLPVDHDHETGVVRGLVCTQCNSAMGTVGDSAIRLRAMAEYLEAHRG
jgi:hypothetical protein